jgi:hypothetical protein
MSRDQLDERFLKPVDYRGIWWLPDKPDKRVPGVLSFDPQSGIELKLDSLDIEDHFSRMAQKPTRRELMVGEAQWGRPISLLGCWDYGTSVHPAQAIVGISLTSADEPTFSSVSVHTPDLLAWASTGNIEIERPPAHSNRTVAVAYNQPPTISVTVDDAQIEFAQGCVQSGSPGYASIREVASIHVQTSKPLSLDSWTTNFVDPLAGFVAFAAGTPLEMSGLEVFSPRETHELPSGRVIELPLEVLYRPALHPRDKRTEHLPDALFRLSDVQGSLQGLLERWFALRREVPVAIDYLLSNRGRTRGLLEHRFLSAVLGIEALHRSTRVPIRDRGRHQDRVDAVVAAVEQCCPQHKRWVKGRIKHPDEANLEQRLRELIDEHEPVAALISDRSAFMNSVVSTRTYFAHGIRRDGVLVDDFSRLYRVVCALEMLLECELLRALGGPDSALCASVTHTQSYVALQSQPL